MTSKPERPGAATVDVGAAVAAASSRSVAHPVGRRFQRADRLLDSRDFTRVLRRGRRRSCPQLVVVTTRIQPGAPGAPSGGEGPGTRSRLGITVGRKAGPSVKRNRFKRRVREWFRHHRDGLQEPIDIVVIARRPGIDLELAELGDHLSRLLGLEGVQVAGNAQDF